MDIWHEIIKNLNQNSILKLRSVSTYFSQALLMINWISSKKSILNIYKISIAGGELCFWNQVFNGLLKNQNNNKIHFCCYNNNDKLFIDINLINDLSGFNNVNLSHCSVLRNDFLERLNNVPNLNLYNCHKITDEGLFYLKNVHIINIVGCNITNDGLLHLIHECPINEICLEKSKFMTDEILNDLKIIPKIYISNNEVDPQFSIQNMQKYLKNTHLIFMYPNKNNSNYFSCMALFIK